MAVFIRGGYLHGFGDRTDIFSGVVSHCLQIKVLKNVEHLNNHDATPGWVIGRHPQAPIRTPQRFLSFRRVFGEIICTQQRIVTPHVCIDLPRNVTAIKDLSTSSGNSTVSLGHAWIANNAANRLDLSLIKINLPPIRRIA